MQAGVDGALKEWPGGELRGISAASEEWLLAQRIAASRGFQRSELLQRFLLGVCELALDGRAHEINEQFIGIRIFGRPEGYDPGEDNIVRSYARMLRRRLDAYFAEEGVAEPLRLTIPRGGYVPVFEPVQGRRKPAKFALPAMFAVDEEAANPPAVDRESARRPQAQARWRAAALAALAGLAMGLGAWKSAEWFEARQSRPAAHALWVQMFDKNRNTLIVPADSGLGILENLTHMQASLDNYVDGSFFVRTGPPSGLDAGNFNDLSRQHYTSVIDLGICAELERLPEFTADRTQIRYARSITAEEIRKSNVILLGSVHTNPWVALFEPKLNFELAYTPEVDRSFIINHHPLTGEREIYRNGAESEHEHTYGTVTYLPVAGDTGRVLIVQGLNMAATQASADVLFSAAAMGQVLHAATKPDGKLRSFELLVETTSIGASAPEARIIATRIYQ